MAENGRGEDEETALLIKVEKRPISQAQLIGFALVLATQAFIAGGLYYKFTTLATDAASKQDFALLTAKVDSQEATRTARSAVLDRNIDDIQAQLRPLSTIELRLDQNDKRDDAQDARLDRLLDLVSGKFDTFGARFDELSKAVGEVKSDVRVVAQDVKNLATKASPTAFKP